ncbi:MAG: hypothetical protein R2700_12615 [Solirubrobacterales bacterium]
MLSLRARSVTASVALVALIAALGGCGGPDVDLGSGDQISVRSGEASIAADSICGQVARSFAAAQRESPRTFSQGAVVLERLIDIAREGEEHLAALDPPAGSAEAFRRYLQARGEVVAQLERARDAAASEDGSAYERARRKALDGASQRFKLAVRAGLDGCAKVERGRSDE